MTRNESFARRLSEMMHSRNLSPRQLSVELGIDYKRLCRWMSRGICRPTNRTAGDLEKLRRYFGLKSAGQLWTGLPAESSSYGEKVRVLLESPLPVQERQQLCAQIDLLWSAYDVNDKLWNQHAAIWRQVTKTERPGAEDFAVTLDLLRDGTSPGELIEQLLEFVREDLAKGVASEALG